jgi:RNA recognition motif-containing protein
LPPDTTKDELKSHFEQIGHVSNVQIERPGYAFCELGSDNDVQNAIDQFDHTDFRGQNIRVRRAP